MKPFTGDMEPTAFVCKGCGARVQEEKYGSGFKSCGMVVADRKYYLCCRCLSFVMELLEALPSSESRGKFSDELRLMK